LRTLSRDKNAKFTILVITSGNVAVTVLFLELREQSVTRRKTNAESTKPNAWDETYLFQFFVVALPIVSHAPNEPKFIETPNALVRETTKDRARERRLSVNPLNR
jgi:hypothetical protein